MKKMLIVFDGEHFSRGAFDFAARLNEKEPILLTGLFLPSVDYLDVMIYYLGGMSGPAYLPSLDTDPMAMEKNIALFKELCLKNNIEHRVHSDWPGTPLEVIKKESRYADALILSSELFYSNLGKDSHEEYLKDAMHNAECPVIIVPEEYNFPESIIMAYDGTESSVFAIKQFSYVLPSLSQLSTLVVYASDQAGAIPDHAYIEELAARHFKNLTFTKLDVDASKYFATWLMERGNALLVTGSFGRTPVSEFFKKNFVSEIIKDHKLPLFIAHK